VSHGSGVFISVEVDREGGKRSGGTTEVDVETFLETVLSYTYNPTNTHLHTYIPWINKSVIKNLGGGTRHKYAKYTNLRFKMLQIFYNNSIINHR